MCVNNLSRISFGNYQNYNNNYHIQSDKYRSSKDDKKGLSTGAKVGLGLVALAAVGACLVSKGRSLYAAKLKEVAKSEGFVEAKTYEEAQKYAMDNFGMKLELNNNVYGAKFDNEICYNVNKRFKGKATLPRKVILEDIIRQNDGGIAGGVWYEDSKTLGFREVFKLLFNNAQKQGKSIIRDWNQEYMIRTAYHELGHAQHFAVCKEADKMSKGSVSKYYTREFLNDINNPENKKIMKEFFKDYDYVCTSPGEFVAETFAYKMMDKPVPKVIDDMYIKYGGRPVPALGT